MRGIHSLAVAAAFAAGVSSAMADAVDIGSRRELFVDTLLIGSMSNATLVLQKPKDEGIGLRFDQPWEGAQSIMGSVIQDGPVYRLYYRGLPTLDVANDVLCYVESTNGIDWVRPNLGRVMVNGSTSNNIVRSNLWMSVFLDRRPGVPASERYKAIDVREDTELIGYTSSNGLDFVRIPGPLLTGFEFDSMNLAFYSEAEGKYVYFYRDWYPGHWSGYRRIRRGSNATFGSFADQGVMEYQYNDGQSHPTEHHYINGTFPYSRAPHIYIALAARFYDDATESDSIFMTTRPGAMVYDRQFPGRYVVPAAEIGPQKARSNYAAWNTAQTGPREMSFYMDHNYSSPSNHMRRYSLRLDGFAAVSVTNGAGEMLTKPLTFAGKALLLNYLTRSNGSVRVEIQNTNGVPVSGYALADAVALAGDEIEGAATWTNDLGTAPLAGQPVQLRFVMENADLFAMQVATAFEAADAPSQLTVVNTGSTHVALQWMDNSAFETGFRLERSTNGVNWVLDQLTSANVTNALSVGLRPVTGYDYRVQAFSESDATIISSTCHVQTATFDTLVVSGNTYRVYTFLDDGDFDFAGGTVEYLVVGGGGGGGGYAGGGGGGAGGIRTGSFDLAAGVYNVTVGAGGAGGTASADSDGAAGGDSIFSTITAAGGGGGGAFGSIGLNGGSGGGAGWPDVASNVTAAGGAGNTPGTSPAQGSDGGSSSKIYLTDLYYHGGGGGGAGAAGHTGIGTNFGGSGLPSSISGTAITYAGGGGGANGYRGGTTNYTSAGGAGGGGAGGGNSTATKAGLPGADGSGGGGGGSGYDFIVSGGGGNGGSGVVIVRHPVEVEVPEDADGDGLSDAWEIEHGGTNLFASGADYDHDGLNDDAERIAGTTPTNALSVLRVDEIAGLTDTRLQFGVISGRTYHAHWSPALPETNWWLLPGTSVTATADGEASITDTNTATQRFYRLSVEIP